MAAVRSPHEVGGEHTVLRGPRCWCRASPVMCQGRWGSEAGGHVVIPAVRQPALRFRDGGSLLRTCTFPDKGP